MFNKVIYVFTHSVYPIKSHVLLIYYKVNTLHVTEHKRALQNEYDDYLKEAPIEYDLKGEGNHMRFKTNPMF